MLRMAMVSEMLLKVKSLVRDQKKKKIELDKRLPFIT